VGGKVVCRRRWQVQGGGVWGWAGRWGKKCVAQRREGGWQGRNTTSYAEVYASEPGNVKR